RIEFVLPEPFAPFLRTVGTVLPKHILEKTLQERDSQGKPLFLSTWSTGTDPRKVIGNGPYTMTQYATSQRIIFERNPNYWRKDNQGQAMPYIQRLISQIVESTDTSLLQFRSGGLDLVFVSPENFRLLKREEQRGKFSIHNGGPAAGTSFISFNLNKAKNSKGQPLVDPIKSRWFNTLAFRQAVAYGIDRQKMINNVFRGLGQPQNSPISVQSPYYLPPEEGLTVYNYDPKKAKELLKGAGFKYDSEGQLLDSEGNRVRFTLITNAENRTRVSMAAQVKQDLDKLGMQVDLNPISFNTLVGKISDTFDWECYLLGLTGGVEPNNGANVWRSTGGLHSFNQSAQPGQPPLIGWQVSDWEKEIDRLYIQGARELDEAKRKAIYAQTQQIIQEQVPVIYLVNPLSLSAIRDRIEGIQYSALGGALWNIQELTIAD
ncbi:MAG: ABC transporter substrate-binding protein, partial [Leptolyngbyaceae cyanobacterium bins.59]|nr:ABC transporter substrate-binding protein [Leptolyngbyaceae cyanobacterium bins.59]